MAKRKSKKVPQQQATPPAPDGDAAIQDEDLIPADVADQAIGEASIEEDEEEMRPMNSIPIRTPATRKPVPVDGRKMVTIAVPMVDTGMPPSRYVEGRLSHEEARVERMLRDGVESTGATCRTPLALFRYLLKQAASEIPG